MRVVTKIRRQIAGKVYEPGQECDVDDAVAHQEIADGRLEKPGQQSAAAPAAPAPKDAPAPDTAKPAPAAPKASTEVKPVSTADGPNQGEYATRDLKAKG